MNTAGPRDLVMTPPAYRPVDAVRRQRGGMTLVEIMVTIAVIGVLVGLLIPALGVARESARRTTCSNHISQLALGMIAHDMERSSLPGWRNSVTGYTTVTGSTVSWTVPVLPFVGENELYDWYREYATGTDDVTRKRVALFVCPSAETVERATISYMGNAGTGAEVLNTEVSPALQFRGDGALVDTVGNGVYSALRSNLDQIALGDGVAGTLLLIERCGPLAPTGPEVKWTAHPLASSGGAHLFTDPLSPPNPRIGSNVILHPPLTLISGSTHPSAIAKSINPNPVRLENPDTLPASSGDWMYRYPSSRHKGGVTAAFCDGHVRFLGDKIAPWVYCQLLTSIKKQRSPRAISWEQYQVEGVGPWVSYILDETDLVK